MSLVNALIWWLSILGAAWVAFPVVRQILNDSTDDVVWSFAIPLGVLFFCGLNFPMMFLADSYFSRALAVNGLALFLILLRLAQPLWAMRGKIETARAVRELTSQFSSSSIRYLFWISCCFAMLSVMKSFHSELVWGERPMDSTFLHFFARLPQLPPTDPWVAGNPMRYYYVGSYIWGTWSHLLQMDPGFTYNLSMVAVFTFAMSACYGIFRLAGLGSRWSTCASALLLLSGNFETLKLWFEKHPLTFDMFWKASRVFESPAFAEFPLWAFIFNDLHAHVIAYPIFLVLVGFLFILLRSASQNVSPWTGLLFGLIVGLVSVLLVGTNVWHAILLAPLVIYVLLTTRPRSWIWPVVGSSIPLASHMFLLWGSLAGGGSMIHGFFPGPFNSPWQVIRFAGYAFVPGLVAGLGILLRTEKFRWTVFFFIGLFPQLIFWIIAVLGLKDKFLEAVPTMALASALSLVFAASFSKRLENRPVSFLLLSLWLCSVTIGWVEILHIFDRMNLIFKFYSILTPLAFLASLGLVGLVGPELPAFLRRPSAIAGGIYIPLLLVSGGLLFWIMSHWHFRPGPRPILDGKAFLSNSPHGDTEVFEWINKNVGGTPYAVEVAGGYYDDRARFAMYTGLPTFMGWEHHSRQRGATDEIIRQRVEIIDLIYSTVDPNQAWDLCRQNKIEWIYIGELENRKYDKQSLAKFETSRLFRLGHRSKNSAVYQVKESND